LGENYDEIRLGCGALPLRLLYRCCQVGTWYVQKCYFKKKKEDIFF